MPASLITARHKWVSLKVDSDLPESERPAFRVRPLTMREVDRIGKAIKAGDADDGAREAVDLIGANFVTGWRNLRADDPGVREHLGGLAGDDGTIPYDEASRVPVLRAVLSPEESQELAKLVERAYSASPVQLTPAESPAGSA